MTDTKSTVQTMGDIVTQIIHFSSGNKRTFHNIITKTIQDGSYTKMWTSDGRMLMVNGKNVDCIEVLKK